MKYRYSAFGLCIGSDIKFEELTLERNFERKFDITISKSNLNVKLKPLGEEAPSIDYNANDGVMMIWPGAAAIKITDLQKIEIQEFPNVPEKYLAFPVLGPVMGWLLHQRGLLVLHSSAVSIDGRSVAFMGDKTAGKSTTAAAFIEAGGNLLTDDLLVIDTKYTPKPRIRSSFAQLKLNEDSIQNIRLSNAKTLPLVLPDFEKRQFRLPALAEDLLPVDTFFIIERSGNKPGIKWLENGKAFSQFLRYSYQIRFHQAPATLQHRKRQFQQCVLLDNKSSVGILTIPDTIEKLDETVKFVREYLSANSDA